jgi:NitT/TauT family transport system ATP-binding protein
MSKKIEIVGIRKQYGKNGSAMVRALENVNLAITQGEFVSILGPSGCGKSTLLYIVGGFEKATAGQIKIDGHPVTGPGADRGMMFQDYALFPWRTVIGNVTFGLQLKGVPVLERVRIARDYINLVGLSGFEDKYPHELSGGMRQRCALARCVANDPDVLLMDEPLAAIDALTRNVLQDEILKVCIAPPARSSKTVIYVTHSIEEALFLSDRIIVMSPRPGRVIKEISVPFGRPRDDSTRLSPDFRSHLGEIWDLLKTTMKLKEGENQHALQQP